jgi:hypothetical protein
VDGETVASQVESFNPKTKMSENELRELNAWIAEHVMGWHKVMSRGDNPFEYWDGSDGAYRIQTWRPTTDPAAAFAVLEKCQERLDCEDVVIGFCTGTWCIRSIYRENPGAKGRINIFALPPSETSLPLAICLFAKQLFST